MKRKKKKISTAVTHEQLDAQAAKPGAGLIAEFWEFFRTNKKWWMMPIVAVLLVLAGLVLLGGTALAPFIYTMF
jgi:hypothetical protein